jgi:hypothetical protein
MQKSPELLGDHWGLLIRFINSTQKQKAFASYCFFLSRFPLHTALLNTRLCLIALLAKCWNIGSQKCWVIKLSVSAAWLVSVYLFLWLHRVFWYSVCYKVVQNMIGIMSNLEVLNMLQINRIENFLEVFKIFSKKENYF